MTKSSIERGIYQITVFNIGTCHPLVVVLNMLNKTLSSVFQLSIGDTGLQERAGLWDTVSWREDGNSSCG